MSVTLHSIITEDNTNRLIRHYENGVRTLRKRVGGVIADTARVTAPRETGYMAGSIVDDRNGTVVVPAFYGMFVNYGTRYMMPEPFFSRAVAGPGLAAMKEELRRLFGQTGNLHIDEVSPFIYAPLAGTRRPYEQQKAMFAAMRDRGNI